MFEILNKPQHDYKTYTENQIMRKFRLFKPIIGNRETVFRYAPRDFDIKYMYRPVCI